MRNILVTGAAGFIGSFLCKALIEAPETRVVGLDNMNSYYDVSLKAARIEMIKRVAKPTNFTFIEGDITDFNLLERLFSEHHFSVVVNLAAQAGVRYSIENPRAYIDSNVVGFFNVLECCRDHPVDHLVFASSSSVYGGSSKVPFSETDRVDSPVSLYAATKKADELLAHAYSTLYDIPCTGLRFFTVYGPMGRPDMSYFKFTEHIVNGKPIQIYNMGDMRRDFTYIDDIVSGIQSVIDNPPITHGDCARYAIFNVGNSDPITLNTFVNTLERILHEEGLTANVAIRELLPMQPGDVYQTYADTSELERRTGYRPATPLEYGLRQFARWYRTFYSSKL